MKKTAKVGHVTSAGGRLDQFCKHGIRVLYTHPNGAPQVGVCRDCWTDGLPLPPLPAGGPFAVMRMPVKGFVIAGGKQQAAYYDTDEEMTKAYLALCQSETGTNDDDIFTAGVLKCITGSGWARVADKESITVRPLAFSALRLENAFLCTYGEGLIVCRGIEAVGMMLEEFLEFKYPPRPKPQPGFGKLTAEELAEMLRDQGQDEGEGVPAQTTAADAP